MIWLALAFLVVAAFLVPRLGKVLLGIVSVGLLLGLAFWGYTTVQHKREYETPIKQTSLDGIALGQPEDKVLLAKGKPVERLDEDDPSDGFGMAYNAPSDALTLIWFDKNAKVKRVCRHPSSTDKTDVGAHPDLNMRDYYVGADAAVLDRLGPNFHSSTSEDRLAEARTWPDYNLAFDVEQGKISVVCVTSDVVRYAKEYKYESPNRGSAARRIEGGSGKAEHCYEPADQKLKPAGTCSWEEKQETEKPASP